jgi:hypothetical protein
MKKNMGTLDRGLRLVAALVLVALYFTNTISGTVGYISLVVAPVFALTSVVSFCPAYTLLGMNTCKKD